MNSAKVVLGAADAFRSAEETRVHHAAWRRGGVAARGACAAARDASDWAPSHRVTGPYAHLVDAFAEA